MRTSRRTRKERKRRKEGRLVGRKRGKEKQVRRSKEGDNERKVQGGGGRGWREIHKVEEKKERKWRIEKDGRMEKSRGEERKTERRRMWIRTKHTHRLKNEH